MLWDQSYNHLKMSEKWGFYAKIEDFFVILLDNGVLRLNVDSNGK